MAVRKALAFLDQAIQVRRFHVGVAQRADGVKALLVCDNENDIGAFGGHELSSSGVGEAVL